MKYNGIAVNKDCSAMKLEFEVESNFITYELNDFDDECLPFTVEGHWNMK